MSKTFCLYPFTHLEIKNNGEISPCCRMDGGYTLNGRDASILRDDLTSVLESDHAIEIRKALLSGERYPQCHRCWRDEDLGLDSQRSRYNRRFVDYIDDFKKADEYKLLSLDLKLGNTCNQMCVICSPINSSLIAAEEKIDLKLDWYRDKKSIDKIYSKLDDIKHIEFYGGEPWLIKQHWQLLNDLISRGKSQNISLNYATNGSLYEEKYFTEIFSKFKSISILYSADGTFETFEYCRYPGNWKTFDDNLKKGISHLNNNITARIAYTISIYSVFNIIDSLKYYSSLSTPENKLVVWFNIVNEPKFSISNLPDEIKDSLIEYIENNWNYNFPVSDRNVKNSIIAEISKKRSIKDWTIFKKTTKQKDMKRNLSITDIIPLFKKYF